MPGGGRITSFSIRLPHNSALICWEGFQEFWRHEVSVWTPRGVLDAPTLFLFFQILVQQLERLAGTTFTNLFVGPAWIWISPGAQRQGLEST